MIYDFITAVRLIRKSTAKDYLIYINTAVSLKGFGSWQT